MKKSQSTTLPAVDNRELDRAFTKAEAMLKYSDRLAHTKYVGLANLDEFNEIMLAMGTAMFQLGVKHGTVKR